MAYKDNSTDFMDQVMRELEVCGYMYGVLLCGGGGCGMTSCE